MYKISSMQTLHKWNRLQLHGLHISLPTIDYDNFPKLKKRNSKEKATHILS